jgi:hypothetical protein
MNQPDQPNWRALLGACALLAAAAAQAQTTVPEPSSTDTNVPPATAQKQVSEISRGDPARWYREDLTVAARLRTLQKEIAAGLQEAQGACRKLPAAERADCLAEARATYKQDMAGARAQAMADLR